jgi:electron transfer flavoprotein beta subunit
MRSAIVVCLKQVLDTNYPLQILENEKRIIQQDEADLKYLINPPDKSALEEAFKLKKFLDADVIAISLGNDNVVQGLRYCLARGANKAIHIQCPQEFNLDPWQISQLLSKEIKTFDYRIVLCGDKSLDNIGGQVGPAIAELLDIPQVTRLIKLEIGRNKDFVTVTRLLEKGNREIIECKMPVLLTVAALINNPAYVSVNRIQKIDPLHIEKRAIKPFDISNPLSKVIEMSVPRPRAKKISTPNSNLSAA